MIDILDNIKKLLIKYAFFIFLIGIMITFYITEANSDSVMNMTTGYKPIVQNREEKIKELIHFYDNQTDLAVKPTRAELQELLNLYKGDIYKISEKLKNKYDIAPEAWQHTDYNSWNNYRKLGEGIIFILVLVFGIYKLPNSIVNKQFIHGVIIFIILISIGFLVDYTNINLNYSTTNIIIYILILLGLIFIIKNNKINLELAYIYLKLELKQLKFRHLFILAILLIIFFALLFGLPSNNLYFWLYLPKYYTIQEKPIYLNYQTVFDTQSKKIIDETDISNNITASNSDNNIGKFNYNYCISSWININPQPPSYKGVYNQYITLVNFNNKPSIYYKASENHLKIIMNQATDNNENKSIVVYESYNLPLQKWNHFCLNYQNNNIDIFINNKLVATKTNIIPWMTKDNITIGKKNGIEGGFKNILYFTKPLSITQIKYLYDYQK